MINPTPNQSRAIEILNCIAFLKTLTPQLDALAKDTTPMPDGVGTVASAISFAAAELEMPWLQIEEAGRSVKSVDAPAPTVDAPAPTAATPAPTAAVRQKNTVNGREVG